MFTLFNLQYSKLKRPPDILGFGLKKTLDCTPNKKEHSVPRHPPPLKPLPTVTLSKVNMSIIILSL